MNVGRSYVHGRKRDGSFLYNFSTVGSSVMYDGARWFSPNLVSVYVGLSKSVVNAR